jgi:hypothetical protein
MIKWNRDRSRIGESGAASRDATNIDRTFPISLIILVILKGYIIKRRVDSLEKVAPFRL